MFRRILLVILICLPFSAAVVVSEVRERPRRFAELEAGKIFRSGYPSASQLRNLDDDVHLRSVLSLTEPVDEPHERDLLVQCKSLGLLEQRVPLPGNGCGRFEDLDRAVDIVAEQSNWPILFHCQAGKQRSNAVTAAYRLKHCGWTLDQALDELEKHHGLDRHGEEKDLVEHLAKYADWLKDRATAGADGD